MGLERVAEGLVRCVPARVLARLCVCPLRVELNPEDAHPRLRLSRDSFTH